MLGVVLLERRNGVNVTFVLPGRGRSGGVRVTVEMARMLLSRGFGVRILAYCPPVGSKRYFRELLDSAWCRIQGLTHVDWLADFEGGLESYTDINAVEFKTGEVVIAVGAMTVEAVRQIRQSVIKLRYCHGFSTCYAQLMQQAWGGEMPTIAVARTLVPQLEQYSGHGVLAVVPNGHRTDEYFDEGIGHDGIGMVFSGHPNKAPAFALALLRRIHERWPDVPLYVFGEPPRPRGIPRDSYWRFPSVVKARELYSRSMIWLVPSIDEGLPAPPLEAMSCGSVVVSTDNLGCREIIEPGHNGFLVPIGDIEGFMRCIGRLMNDELLRRRMVDAGQEKVRLFTWENAAEHMEAVLNSIA